MLPVKRTNPIVDRNCEPIADALRCQVVLDTKNLQLLEIHSGTGQHLGFLAPLFKNIIFHPTDGDPVNLSSIRAYAEDCTTNNIMEPLLIDITRHPREWTKKFPEASFDYMLNINMMHINPFDAAVGLFQAAGILLKPKGKLFTYGAYAENCKITPKSNVQFDESLKIRNPEWGIRDIGDLAKLAKANGIKLIYKLNMPANNVMLTWEKQS